jgi:hypothetical protein
MLRAYTWPGDRRLVAARRYNRTSGRIFDFLYIRIVISRPSGLRGNQGSRDRADRLSIRRLLI